jgi:hypothetical protein
MSNNVLDHPKAFLHITLVENVFHCEEVFSNYPLSLYVTKGFFDLGNAKNHFCMTVSFFSTLTFSEIFLYGKIMCFAGITPLTKP